MFIRRHPAERGILLPQIRAHKPAVRAFYSKL
jgi:hypothetical protein